MKIEGGRIINDFIEPNKYQYVIPVYQRNYEWSRDQCVKLFDDIVMTFKRDRKNHFCGSVVYAPLKEEHNIHYYVIVDGQQRLTTIYLLLKALIDCAETEREKESIEEVLFNHDKFDEYAIDSASKLKLKPIKSDNIQLYLLMENKYDEMDKSSGIWINYDFFKEKIEQVLQEDSRLDVKSIYRGIEKLTCAEIRLDEDDNAQEIFERINSTGVPLSLADQIRNFILMTDADQEYLYEQYWLKMEQILQKEQLSSFFLDYLNLKMERFATEKNAYDDFKSLFEKGNYNNEGMLKELLHYANFYYAFTYGDPKYGTGINEYLSGLRQLKQTTVYLFLFHLFDDLSAGVIDELVAEKVLRLLMNYSIRRIMCEVNSSSLRGLFKTMHNRVFNRGKYYEKDIYYDAIVSFMSQMTSRDVIPNDDDFIYALEHNNLYRKNALCKYLLIGIENQGKEKLQTDNLTIEHVMPQNKNLSVAWQKMLGENWNSDRERWLHTLGNLTLTGYNSEMGDKPFAEKKALIEDEHTHVTVLYQDIQSANTWNAESIKKRGERLAQVIFKLYPIDPPLHQISYKDPSSYEYTCADPKNATYKQVNYYELFGERVNVNGWNPMVRSVAKKLYDMDPSVIGRMAKTNTPLPNWLNPVFSYDKSKVKKSMRLQGTDLYIASGFSAADCIWFIRGMLQIYDLDIEEDFIYSAKLTKQD